MWFSEMLKQWVGVMTEELYTPLLPFKPFTSCPECKSGGKKEGCHNEMQNWCSQHGLCAGTQLQTNIERREVITVPSCWLEPINNNQLCYHLILFFNFVALWGWLQAKDSWLLTLRSFDHRLSLWICNECPNQAQHVRGSSLTDSEQRQSNTGVKCVSVLMIQSVRL